MTDEQVAHEGLVLPRDPELERVKEELLGLDPEGRRFAAALRRTFDMLLDGPNTGRFRWEQLYKTEKTHCGTLVEINLQREFKFVGGALLDYNIAGIEVDCKYSQKLAEWMIPPEALGQLLLGVWASDTDGLWSVGLVRARNEYLSSSAGNRDGKRRLTAKAKSNIHWLFLNKPLPANALLRLKPRDVSAIFAARSGQARLNELLLRAQGEILTRTVIQTVATGGGKPIHDPLRRLRAGNEGARGQLRKQGVVVLGDYVNHRQVAQDLGVPVPGESEFVSVRLVRRSARHVDVPFTVLEGAEWVRAGQDDPVEIAPRLPDVKKSRKLS